MLLTRKTAILEKCASKEKTAKMLSAIRQSLSKADKLRLRKGKFARNDDSLIGEATKSRIRKYRHGRHAAVLKAKALKAKKSGASDAEVRTLLGDAKAAAEKGRIYGDDVRQLTKGAPNFKGSLI